MKRYVSVTLLVLVGMLLAACAAATPQIIEVQKEVVALAV